ncbi:hypothetical protein CGCF415_v002609 [Colletotrichum fructicola]|uniref:2EXR domain-containing protein n=1 Tax=Colletotrichum fructicola (strain Nara gc5) TaxID=1213859 RepID=L2G8T7_COLFN|nr:uncharacterized protein CGMCC3_g503 [Colletotrichum fructicola]KAF4486819.1 hypothetical protein CGGC5_v005108 [Colletotrichum fructicola Nara gc5]KAI8280881.1 hypothetical protein K4K60_004545 [Colletotrichum sp. SAR11_57]KAE9583772.1 hypothetical protein CGMCC3_g503 [Colletotrichum fructicola]KAF4418624.1 hypothetical protein CFRS1_v015581 [Colletotrichum fructicola]KAF4882828.1 hypothetical protein CGCFRS4_v014163 [Colletotrichum fructicola]
MTDSSDESATEGVGLVQNDASDSENSVDSEVEDQGTGFLDVEASESGDSDSESSDDSSDEESDYDDILGAGSSRKTQPKVVFTQFKKLPIELRHRIWQYFCPDLDRSPRVLSFQMVCSPTQDVIWESATLDNQIRAVDAMLGLHQESREIALKAFPDTLAIREGRRIVHFNKERDIVHINGHRKEWAHNAVIPGFSENVLHLAADIDFLQLKEMQTLASFPEVINFYKFEWHNEGRPPKKLRWCASDKIHRYELQQLQRECRIGEDLHFVYCWPDVDKHPEFAAKHASEQFAAMDGLDELGDELRETILEGDLDLEAETVGEWDVMFEQLCDIKYWRMTCFGWDAADRFPAFLTKHGDAREYDPNEDEEGDEVGESSEEDDSDQNEYESDGIDDATIDEESVNEDPDVDDLEIDGSQESEDDEDGGASDFGGFSPLRDEDGGSMLVDGDASAAQFSSPEPEAAGDRPRGRGGRPLVVLDDDDEEEETEGQDSQPPARRRQREFIQIDSEIDDEDDEEEQPAQSTTRRRRVVVSDDEDEDEEDEGERPARPVGRRARVLPSDDEEEDEDDGGAEVGNDKAKAESDEEDEPSRAKKPLSLAEKLQRNRQQNPISDESEEEESSEEDAPPKKMSLAEKLMAHRRKNPIESESEPETEGTIGVDDTDDEEDEEEDEDEESGMFMNMAEEGESGDEQDEDDY